MSLGINLIIGPGGGGVGGGGAPAAWTPASLPNLVAWFDAQDAATITQSSGVSNWANKKSGGGDASQSTAGSRPSYSATGLNSLPAVVGAAGKLLSTNLTVAQPLTAAVVAQVTNTAANRAVLGTSTGSVFNGIFNDTSAGGMTHQYGSQWTNGTITSPTVAISIANGASSLLSSNGTTNGGHNAGAAGLTNISLLAWGGGNDNWIGGLGEVVICSSALGTTDRQKLEGYLAWKWGLQSGLPGGHPYKTAPP